MDPSIMKLLEEDEDETMHSGADVEAFTAALNRDIEGDNTSTSQPSDSDTAALSKGIYHTSSQLFPQWHTSSQDETANTRSQQNLNGSQQQAQHSSEMDLKQHGSGPENQRQQIDNQLLDDRRQRQAEQNTLHFSRPPSIHNSEKNPELPKINQHAVATEQKPGNPRGQVPFGLLLPLLTPQLDKDRSMQLQTVFNKLKKNEISKDIFVHNMRSIVGDQMLKIAVYKLHAQGKQARNSQTGPNQLSLQSQASAQEQHQKMQTVGPHQGNVPQSFAQLHQKGGTGDMSHIPSSASQLKSDSANSTMGKKPSFPNYGSAGNSYHPFSGSNVNASAASLKQQPHDSQMRQGSVHQSIDANQQNLVHWQSTGQEQKNGAQSSMAYVKQEPVDQGNEQQYKSRLSSPRGLSSFSPSQAHGNAMTGTLKDDALEMQSARMGFSGITSTVPSNTASSSTTAQLDPNNSLSSRIPSALTPVGPGNNAKTPPKRPPIGQKKPLESLGSSPPLSSKKQKVSGTFADQSIDQLNDVTAVSGVNLREEEEQLLSGPKEESRVSEASRRVVQEEEERLILQKIPLQKKLAEIMSKCGVKSSSNDVERCLSLCVEERMRGLISNLIRLSKQRVDIEKPRHQTIVTSDVRKQILAINQKAREEWEKKQSEAEKLQKLNELDGDAGVDGDKERDDGRVKTLKANKDEDDKMRATAANVAARAAVGGDDMLSKWQLMAEQARQKREGGGVDVASGSQPSKEMSFKPSSTSAKNARDIEGGEKRVPSAASLAFGSSRKLARNQVVVPQTKATPSISIKDVIAVLEREPQMSKSTVMYRLYEKMRGDAVAE
ncbi:hypothetical protein RHMOL_Rhmol07G0285500 [Rhododendron molle]|uniref:Uncharacterized protein n=1 Tax=Rhododendron molle TaxID=49168 RepID=A0ACC0N5I8_RHOML|nr:hypothetical protein RHMOL_Rhmol07G0285500 [Rhododendron molle]